eukprot:2803137-Rhodomonas_salina.1
MTIALRARDPLSSTDARFATLLPGSSPSSTPVLLPSATSYALPHYLPTRFPTASYALPHYLPTRFPTTSYALPHYLPTRFPTTSYALLHYLPTRFPATPCGCLATRSRSQLVVSYLIAILYLALSVLVRPFRVSLSPSPMSGWTRVVLTMIPRVPKAVVLRGGHTEATGVGECEGTGADCTDASTGMRIVVLEAWYRGIRSRTDTYAYAPTRIPASLPATISVR